MKILYVLFALTAAVSANSCSCTCCSGFNCSPQHIGAFSVDSCGNCDAGGCRSNYPNTCPPDGQNGVVAASCSGSCFSGEDVVNMADGSTKRVQDIAVGDRVLTVVPGDHSVVPDVVFRVTHADADAQISFIRLRTSAGQAIDLTPGHYIHVADVNLDTLKRADAVAVGDVVFVVGAPGRPHDMAWPTTVAHVDHVMRRGAFNFHVRSGTVVVNGVVASHFTEESSWTRRRAALWWYSIVESLPAPLRTIVGGPADVRQVAAHTK
eukprot:TRINITY_DN58084_c0_g1_i1.p1 TRINITY_DN58084_c0_g1~~TRINITY_DN58084_c0_g1_i1.p1  ORF type:complete len:265 (-),score=49.98 TRINITY_DN58084_c0_g1_i1:199-993(-)